MQAQHNRHREQEQDEVRQQMERVHRDAQRRGVGARAPEIEWIPCVLDRVALESSCLWKRLNVNDDW
jgi:hypothetical protein